MVGVCNFYIPTWLLFFISTHHGSTKPSEFIVFYVTGQLGKAKPCQSNILQRVMDGILFIFHWIHTVSIHWCNDYLICHSKQTPDVGTHCNCILNDITEL